MPPFPRRAWPGPQNSAAAVLEVAANVLDARIAEAKGDSAAAIASWRKAVEAEDRLAYDEPPGWYYPTRESLGAALLRAGQAAEAEAVFRADLESNPRNGRSLFGLAKSLEAQKKTPTRRSPAPSSTPRGRTRIRPSGSRICRGSGLDSWEFRESQDSQQVSRLLEFGFHRAL